MWVENAVENPTWFSVENNRVSLTVENEEKVIKLEKDMTNNYSWESWIEIKKEVTDQNSVLPTSDHQV